MKRINNNDDVDMSEIIKGLIKDYDSLEFMSDNINMIINKINNLIDFIIYDKYNMEIKLSDNYVFGVNYDFKNYPLISFNCNTLKLNYCSTIIVINDNLIIDLSELEMKNFERIV